MIISFQKTNFFKILCLTLLVINLTIHAEKGQKNGNSFNKEKLILLPLPFYGPTTGLGLTLKLLHTNVGANVFFDSTSFATTNKQFAIFNSIGQRSIPQNSRLFWTFVGGAMSSEKKFYGLGNDTSKYEEATYKARSYFLNLMPGFKLTNVIKVNLIYNHYNSRYMDFDDPSGQHTKYWNNLDVKSFITNKIGLGLEIVARDSRVNPRRGVRFFISSKRADQSFISNTYSANETEMSLSFYFILFDTWTHGTNFKYIETTSGTPIFNYPKIMVRGIEKMRHQDKISYVVQNEERFYLTANWSIVPFIDFGRVSNRSGNLTKDIHIGYGIGGRYIIEKALVIRLDFAFSSNKEHGIVFNYGHTF